MWKIELVHELLHEWEHKTRQTLLITLQHQMIRTLHAPLGTLVRVGWNEAGFEGRGHKRGTSQSRIAKP